MLRALPRRGRRMTRKHGRHLTARRAIVAQEISVSMIWAKNLRVAGVSPLGLVRQKQIRVDALPARDASIVIGTPVSAATLPRPGTL